MRVWFPRLLRRTVRRLRTHEVLWNGNRESIGGAFLGWNALVPWTMRGRTSHGGAATRRGWPTCRSRGCDTQAEVDRFLLSVGLSPGVSGADPSM